MDAKTLFQEGVVAIRDQKDAARGRDLLMQSLKIEPKNEMAWLWLSRTIAEPDKKIQCLERALKLNPANEQTKALILKLTSPEQVAINEEVISPAPTPAAVVAKPAPKPAPVPVKQAVFIDGEDEDAADWKSLRISTNEMRAVSATPMKPTVNEDMDDMGLTPDLGALFTAPSTSEKKPIKRITAEVQRAVLADNKDEDEDVPDWNSLRISTSEIKAVSGTTMKPDVTEDMEDMGLTPDLGALFTAPSANEKKPIKRVTDEMKAVNAISSEPMSLHALRDEPEENDPAPKRSIVVQPKHPLTAAESTQVKNYLAQAQSLINKNKIEEAIEQWVRVLEIEVDNETAMGNAVRYLSRLKYIDDARELVWNAINSGTSHPSIYLTAIDIAKYQGQEGEADELRVKLVQVPEAGEKTVMSVVEYFVENNPQRALEALDLAIPFYPKNQKLAFKRAQLAEDLGLRKEAATYYEEAAQLGTRSKEGQLADKKLSDLMPHLSDKERGSVALAVREAVGVGVLYLLMAFQDAGLNLLQLGSSRIIGVLMSLVGGYLLVTATSSPQQKPLARLLGGSIPVRAPKEDDSKEADKTLVSDPEGETELPIIPMVVRLMIGVAGVVLLIGAFVLVFSAAIALLRNPKPISIPTMDELFKVP